MVLAMVQLVNRQCMLILFLKLAVHQQYLSQALSLSKLQWLGQRLTHFKMEEIV